MKEILLLLLLALLFSVSSAFKETTFNDNILSMLPKSNSPFLPYLEPSNQRCGDCPATTPKVCDCMIGGPKNQQFLNCYSIIGQQQQCPGSDMQNPCWDNVLCLCCHSLDCCCPGTSSQQ